MIVDETRMLILQQGQHISLKVDRIGHKYDVVYVLQQRPISIVLVVEWEDGIYHVIKKDLAVRSISLLLDCDQYPRRDERHLYKRGFEAERKVYKLLGMLIARTYPSTTAVVSQLGLFIHPTLSS
jgi:hypothetical protein